MIMVKCEQCNAPIYDFQVLCRRCAEHAEQRDGKRALRQISKLANFIMAEVKGEPARSESAVDCAIRIISESKSQLSRE